MTTSLQFTNQALLLLGMDQITAYSDDPVGLIAAALYTTHTDAWLASYPWSFCKKKVKLVATTDPLTGWRYAYTLPSDRLMGSYAVFNSDAVSVAPTREFDIQGTTLLSNDAEVWVDYTFRAAEADWPAYFGGFVVAGLAYLYAMPLTQDASLSQQWETKAFGSSSANGRGGLYGMAMATDAQLHPSNVIVDSPLIQARMS